MQLRAFDDSNGIHWEVWEAHPQLSDRRRAGDRRAIARETGSRRNELATKVPESEGWLVFRSANARRRQAPIPENWAKFEDEQLASLLTVSRPSGPRSRA